MKVLIAFSLFILTVSGQSGKKFGWLGCTSCALSFVLNCLPGQDASSAINGGVDNANSAIASVNGAAPGVISGANDAATQAQSGLATGQQQLGSGVTLVQQQATAAQAAANGQAATLQEQLANVQIPSIPAVPSSLLDLFNVFGSKQEQDILDK